MYLFGKSKKKSAGWRFMAVIAPVSAAVKKISPHDYYLENVIKLVLGEDVYKRQRYY